MEALNHYCDNSFKAGRIIFGDIYQIGYLDVGAYKQLLFDDRFTMIRERISLVVNKPRKVEGHIIPPDKPWEQAYKADAAGVLSFRCASGGSVITIKRARAGASP